MLTAFRNIAAFFIILLVILPIVASVTLLIGLFRTIIDVVSVIFGLVLSAFVVFSIND